MPPLLELLEPPPREGAVARDFFRVSRGRTTRRVLGVAVALVTLGATSMGAHLVTRLPPSWTHAVTLAGGLVVLFGLLLGFGAMAVMLFENVWLAVRPEGLVLHDDGHEEAVPWEDLERVGLERGGWVVFERRGGAPVRWFAGGEAGQVVDRVAEARRKALHGLPVGA